MATVEDTDTESVSGDYVRLGDVHTHGDEEFYECVDEDEMDNEYFDTQDFQWIGLLPRAERGISVWLVQSVNPLFHVISEFNDC